MTKPRIRWSPLFEWWECNDGEFIGCGNSIQEAYDGYKKAEREEKKLMKAAMGLMLPEEINRELGCDFSHYPMHRARSTQ